MPISRALIIPLIMAAASNAAAQDSPLSKASDPRVVELDLTAAPTTLALVPGQTTDVYAYNGTIPGPTLELREGDRLIVHFRNNLPEATTIHWHGLHIPADMDGSPYHLVEPGQTKDYLFNIPTGSAGTYWYHPHPDHVTGRQVGKGLYGGIVVRADDDPLPPMKEQVLLLADNRFREDGSLDFPDPDSQAGRIDFENGREGNVLFVNGEIRPKLHIRPGEVQRWRIINASAARVYRLALPGARMVHVGSDGGLFEHPTEVTELLLAVGDRAEVLVYGPDRSGETLTLETLPYDRYIPQTRPADWNVTRPLADLEIDDEPATGTPVIPAVLRVVPPLDTTQVTRHRIVSFSQGMINGRVMDLNRIDFTGKLGSTEIWEIENLVGMDHPFHLHGVQFQVLDRNGVPEPHRRWEDTINMPKHETARLVVRFADFPGRWMFHCHILAHEDHGMMGVLLIQ